MFSWQDLSAIGTVALAFLALGGAAAAFGVIRQKVKELAIRVDHHGEQIEKLSDMKSSVELLAANTQNAHALLLQKQGSTEQLLAERFEGLRAEVRSFMQGQVAAVRRAPTQQ